MTFNPKSEYVLEDKRVLLRPLQTDDLAYLLPYALNEPETWEYSSVTGAGEENMKALIKQALDWRADGNHYAFIVFDKQSGTYAGITRFYDINLRDETLQLGFTWYGKDFRGTGLNKHCKFLLLQFAFEELGALRVEFRADARNARSIAAMKSIGCKEEGVIRSHMPLRDGGRRDSMILSILKGEWVKVVKAHLQGQLS
jgi:RimJ/RimL family protein N-acetyltransferase